LENLTLRSRFSETGVSKGEVFFGKVLSFETRPRGRSSG
jgi:hypothetical protein